LRIEWTRGRLADAERQFFDGERMQNGSFEKTQAAH
jgi:hypothetical protein